MTVRDPTVVGEKAGGQAFNGLHASPCQSGVDFLGVDHGRGSYIYIYIYIYIYFVVQSRGHNPYQ